MVALEFCRFALKVWVCPAVKVTLEGVRSKLATGAGLTVIVLILVNVPAVAVKVMVVLETTLEGGVYVVLYVISDPSRDGLSRWAGRHSRGIMGKVWE